MKKLITLALIVGATTLTQAQSNLVFNQVLILDFDNNAAEPYIVPEGKVWKVESGASGSTFKVDGNTWTMGDLGSYRMGPIWIPENSALSGSSSDADFISVLEFNVEPTSSSSGGSGGGVSADGLVFSSVINLEFNGTSGTLGNYSEVGIISVPEGKIWKVVSASNYSSAEATRIGYIKIAGNQFNATKNGGIENKWNLFLYPGTYEVYSTTLDNNINNRTVLNILEYEN